MCWFSAVLCRSEGGGFPLQQLLVQLWDEGAILRLRELATYTAVRYDSDGRIPPADNGDEGKYLSLEPVDSRSEVRAVAHRGIAYRDLALDSFDVPDQAIAVEGEEGQRRTRVKCCLQGGEIRVGFSGAITGERKGLPRRSKRVGGD